MIKDKIELTDNQKKVLKFIKRSKGNVYGISKAVELAYSSTKLALEKLLKLKIAKVKKGVWELR